MAKYRISRWDYDAQLSINVWKNIHEFQPTTNPPAARTDLFTFHDTTYPGNPGDGIEYRLEGFISAPATLPTRVGFVRFTNDAPLIENRGKVLLVVDNRFQSLLASHLTQFKQDLIGDGWQIQGNEFVSSTDPVTSVKQKIVNAYAASSQQLKSVILIGHVPVPRSGDAVHQGDGHSGLGDNHGGAWVADSYYGDMTTYAANQGWTDATVTVTQAIQGLRDIENQNTPGDGKFDQRFIPSDIELPVGRIDFNKLGTTIGIVQTQFPGLSATQAEAYLLQRYFQKDHDYRLRLFEAARVARIDSNGTLPGEDSWRYNTSLFGGTQVRNKDWRETAGASEIASWSYLGGTGNHDQVNSAESTGAHTRGLLGLPGHPSIPAIHSVFNQFRGSWQGDWDRAPTSPPGGPDVLDTLMNVALSHPGESLASIWSGL